MSIGNGQMNQRRFCWLLALAWVLLGWTLAGFSVQAAPADVMLALDNSGSMKTNDPKGLMHDVVLGFARHLSPDSRLGVVSFGKGATLLLPLTEANRPDFIARLQASLRSVDYSSLLTDTPAGVERGIYELRQNGRPGVKRIIVLFTDGIVDVGNQEKGLERERWLRSDLAPNAKQLGIHIFGIAFTEQADFQLMQSLAQSTDGEYFRVLLAPDVDAVFQQISQKLRNPPPPPVAASSPSNPAPSASSGLMAPWLVAASGGFLLMLIAVIVLVRRRAQSAAVSVTPLVEELPLAPSPIEEPAAPVAMELHAEIPPPPVLAPPEPLPPVRPAPLPSLSKIVPAVPAPPPVEKLIESLNRPAPNMCQKHPAWKATEFCPECLLMKCKNCMTEKNGRPICSDCAKKLQYR